MSTGTQAQTRVLSIQSSVVYGRVGNKAAVFPLELLGFECDPIHSCQFSNHTGYKQFTGLKTNGADLKILVEGMEKNAFLSQYTHLLTGYMASTPFLEEAVSVVEKLRKANPSLRYVCDPVLGDDGKLYVPEAFVSIYRDRIIPHASVITPNQTEAQFLSGIKIESLGDGLKACQWFHNRGIPTVVLTSVQVSPGVIDLLASTVDPTLVNNAPETSGSESKGSQTPASDTSTKHLTTPVVLHMSVAKIAKYYSGTGDLTAALLLAWLHKDHNLQSALEKSICSVQAILKRTREAEREELMLVQGKSDIEQPVVTFKATLVTLDDLAKLEADRKTSKQPQQQQSAPTSTNSTADPTKAN